MRKTTLLAAIIVVISGLIGATPYIIEETSIENYQQSLDASVVILSSSSDRSLGINADRKLDFGRLKPGTNSTKFLNISIGKKSLLNVETKGNISEVLEHRERFYFHGAKDINLEAKGRNPGNYSGTVNLNFQIPKNQVGAYWLDLKYGFYNHKDNLKTKLN